MQGISKKIALGSAVFAFAVPAPAIAQESVVGGYNESEVVDPASPGDPGTPGDPVDPAASGQSDPVSSSGGSSQSESDSGGSLPFTGLDVALLAVAGAGLVALGFGMRRLTRNPDAA